MQGAIKEEHLAFFWGAPASFAAAETPSFILQEASFFQPGPYGLSADTKAVFFLEDIGEMADAKVVVLVLVELKDLVFEFLREGVRRFSAAIAV